MLNNGSIPGQKNIFYLRIKKLKSKRFHAANIDIAMVG
jgi:hypothetical protein